MIPKALSLKTLIKQMKYITILMQERGAKAKVSAAKNECETIARTKKEINMIMKKILHATLQLQTKMNNFLAKHL